MSEGGNKNSEERWHTRATLLERARDPDDEIAWDEFVSYYQSFIQMVVKKMNVKDKDQEDLVQVIVIKLWKSIPNFQFDHSKAKFRTWLSHIIRNTIIDYVRKDKKDVLHLTDQAILNDISQSSSELDEQIEKEWQLHVTGLAMQKIERTFSQRAVKAFKMSLRGDSIGEISQVLNIKDNSSYKLIKRVKNSFFKEIKNLKTHLEM
ncbi:MAG: sigma-70 family RNA polymerase sigma factor [Planctomycetes bacterium]|nr:sigma-70 family RNA polymerase sigma factor [Planctomycetota bacterium]